jgi:hypothetical protein
MMRVARPVGPHIITRLKTRTTTMLKNHDLPHTAPGKRVRAVSSGPQINEVLCVFDAASLVKNFPPSQDPNNPTGGVNPCIYMVTYAPDAGSDSQAGAELNLLAHTGDDIRWRTTTVDGGAVFSVIFYSFAATGGGNLISAPQPLIITEQVPLPNPQNPTQPTMQTIQDYIWSSTVLAQGNVTYHFSFALFNSSDGSLVGYYSWDPYITITLG